MSDAMTPGAYLRRRREADGLTLDDLALAIETFPAIPALSRVEWLAQIEAGVAPLQVDVMLALAAHPLLALDLNVLCGLCMIAVGLPADPPRLCRACACSELNACRERHGWCGWAEADLCTACAAPAALPIDVALSPGGDTITDVRPGRRFSGIWA